jgi:hypothetical protein
MRRLWIIGLVFVGWPALLHAADEPRALIERAIRAWGGRELLERKTASLTHLRGKIHAGGDLMVPFTGTMLVSEQDGRTRIELRLEVGGMAIPATIVTDAERSWRLTDGQFENFSADEIKSLDGRAYRSRVVGLLALLDDKGFTLTRIPEEKVRGRPADGVKVSAKGQPDINLYFDRETGFLVKHSYRGQDVGDTAESLRETVVADYREVVFGAAEEKQLREAKVDTTGPGLIEFLRRQMPGQEKLEKARKLVRQLGDDTFAVREKATAELIALGAVALPLLRDAAKSPDPEIARRAGQCLSEIGEDSSKQRIVLAVRLLAVRRPAGAVEALLDAVAGADMDLGREIKAALCALAGPADKPDQALTKALTDSDPTRKAVAAAVLGKDGGAYLKEARRRLYGGVPPQASLSFHYIDGRLSQEIEVVDREFFNRVEDREFAKPARP